MLNKNTVDFSQNISPIAFAQKMFVNTSADGTLYLNNWYDVDCDDCLTYNNFVANIKWTYKDLENITAEYSELFFDLQAIAEHFDELNGIPEADVQALVDESLVGTYFVYVAPLDTRSLNHLEADVVGRISEGPCGYQLLRHSRRLCQLLAINAPQTIIQNEGTMLIASMIIHWLGTKIEKV